MEGLLEDAARSITARQVHQFADGHLEIGIHLVDEDVRKVDAWLFVGDAGSNSKLTNHLMSNRVVRSIEELSIEFHNHEDDFLSCGMVAQLLMDVEAVPYRGWVEEAGGEKI